MDSAKCNETPEPEPALDAEGYPTEETLQEIIAWRKDWAALLRFVQKMWKYADIGYWKESKGRSSTNGKLGVRYGLHTGGWSGNESIIEALRKNWIFWTFTWESARRGGHYEFFVETARKQKRKEVR